MNRKNTTTLGIIGAGTMGAAIAANVLRQHVLKKSQLIMNDKNRAILKQCSKQLGVRIANNNLEAVAQSDYIILAIKPQDFPALADELASLAPGKKIFLSIMAGVPIARLTNQLRTRRVVRAMPNLAAQIGQAFVVWKSAFAPSAVEKKLLRAILNAMGPSVQVKKEDDINKATAVSGSGPAYLYYVMELLIDAARNLGFSKALGREMVEQTIRGAWAVYEQRATEPADLRKQVASKGGTTAAALKTFQKNQLGRTITKGVRAAYMRARELSL